MIPQPFQNQPYTRSKINYFYSYFSVLNRLFFAAILYFIIIILLNYLSSCPHQLMSGFKHSKNQLP